MISLSRLRRLIAIGILIGIVLPPIYTIAQNKKPRPLLQNVDKISAIQILHSVSKAYAECKSYHDTGVVKSDITLAFKTYFVRPDRFRFELKNGVLQPWRLIIWSGGGQVQTWWDIKSSIEKQESLLSAFNDFQGVTRGASFSIPVLLLPDAAVNYNFRDAANPVRLDDEMVGGFDCFCVHGGLWDRVGPLSIKLWIDKQSYLIRQIDHKAEIREGRLYNASIKYHPAFNETVTDKMLRFNAPIKK